MLFEITMIQRLTEFLGYPTYSLTVTLASILVFTGIGAMVSGRFTDRAQRALGVVFGVLLALALAYRFGLDPLTDGLLDQALAVRVVVALLVLAPLGLCLGMFMPLGLAAVTAVPAVGGAEAAGERYVAWAWAVNGFFSVIGSVLTTILSMTFGFATVQLLAVAVYALAVATYGRLARALSPTPPRP
jgi:MFS family permease